MIEPGIRGDLAIVGGVVALSWPTSSCTMCSTNSSRRRFTLACTWSALWGQRLASQFMPFPPRFMRDREVGVENKSFLHSWVGIGD